MKGNLVIVERLNALLREELAAINQYIVHAEMCENWGFAKLSAQIKARAICEMKHAEKLIERILFLEGIPDVAGGAAIQIGDNVEAQLTNDRQAEIDGIKIYNYSIHLCSEQGDAGTRQLLESILKDEETHVDWLDTQLEQIRLLGLPNYLAQQAH